MSGAAGSSQWMYASGGYEIENSVRLDGSSAYLKKTPSSSASTRVWTFATWVKRAEINNADAHNTFLGISSGNNPTAGFRFQNDALAYWDYGEGGTNYAVNCSTLETARFHDASAWAHVMIAVNTTHGTNTNRVKIYWNGVLQTLDNTNQGGQGNTYPDENADTAINSHQYELWIGGTSGYDNFDGYLADTYFINNQQLSPSDFGETGDFGEFKPIEYEGSFDAYSHYLNYSNSSDLGEDSSGNSNTWSVQSLSDSGDQMLDTPTNNFCVLSAVDLHTASGDSTTLSEGNLKLSADNGTHNLSLGTFSVSSGKWYWEFKADGSSVNNTDVGFVINKNGTDFANDAQLGASGSGGYAFECETDKVRFNGTASSALSSGIDVGDVVGVALDMDNGKVWWSVNGTFVSSGNPAAGSNEQYSSISGRATPAFRVSNTYINDPVVNFGQDSAFAGFLTAQGNTDGAGNGDFYYTPPSGFLALCSKNLPAPAVTPSKNFNTVQYTGNASSGHAISGVGFKPDWVWMKERNAIGQHSIFDIVRGVEKRLGNGASGVGTVFETSPSGSLTSFDSDGFTVGNEAENNNNNNYVAWNWKGSNTTATNTEGSIDSTVSANVAAGFSIVGYAGDGGVDTIGHGLSAALEFLIVRNRTDGDVNWITWHHKITQTNHNVYLNATTAENNNAQYFFGDNTNMTVPSASVFTVGNNGQVNNSSKNYIAYCFHSVDGFSKFGSWEGNANDDAPFVFTGFKPMWVMWKKVTGSAGWFIHDTKRSPFNKSKLTLAPETNAAEQTSAGGATDMFFLSNGFKLGGAGGDMNGNNETYIYIAFAETPFKYANAH